MNIEELKKKRIIDQTAEEFCAVLLDMQIKVKDEVPPVYGKISAHKLLASKKQPFTATPLEK